MYSIVRTAVGAVLMVPLIRPIVNTVGSVAVTAGQTLDSVHKGVQVMNKAAHRAAELTDLKSETICELNKLDLITMQRKGLIEWAEANEELRVRYEKFDPVV
jgi:hypothetical protein